MGAVYCSLLLILLKRWELKLTVKTAFLLYSISPVLVSDGVSIEGEAFSC